MNKLKVIFTAILMICIVIFFNVNKQDNSEKLIPKEKVQEDKQISSSFPNPDRVVYKIKDKDEYYIFTKQDEVYKELVAKISSMIPNAEYNENTFKGNLSKEELQQVQESGNYIVLDYDRVSKNYVFAMENSDYEMIKLSEPIGVLNISLRNKEEVKKYIDELIKDRESYSMGISSEYKSSNKLLNIPAEYVSKLVKYENDVYQFKIEDKQELDKYMKSFDVSIDGELSEEIFKNSVVMATMSKRDIELVTYEVGNMRYYFSSNVDEKYSVSLFVISKVVNSNCVYREFRNPNLTSYGFAGLAAKISETTIETDNKYEYTKSEVYEMTSYLKTSIEVNSGVEIKSATNDTVMDISEIKKGDLLIVYKTVPFLPEEQGNITHINILSKAEVSDILKRQIITQNTVHGQILKTDLDKNGNGAVVFMINCENIYKNEYIPIYFVAKFKINKDTEIYSEGDQPLNNMVDCTLVLNKPITDINNINHTVLRVEGLPC